MKGVAHGSMVAGLSSCVTAGWIRHRVCEAYDPDVTPPAIKERLRNRMPLVVTGLGFTGLATLVAQSFDNTELRILADSGDNRPIQQQIENHRELHSLPYLGSAVGAGHLIRHSASKFGEWLAAGIGQSDQENKIIEAVNDLGKWIINSSGFGILGHLLGDLPTEGRGGTALRLLKPITNRNFCLKWASHAADPLNKYVKAAGMILTGAAWTFSGLHLCSWEPPERRLQRYIAELGEHESYRAAFNQIIEDLERLFNHFVNQAKGSVWQAPIFTNSPTAIREEPPETWYQLDFDIEQIFGVSSLDRSTLVQEGIIPEAVGSQMDETRISSRELSSGASTETILSSEIQSNGTSLRSESADKYGTSLTGEDLHSEKPLFGDSVTDGSPLVNQDETESYTSIRDETETTDDGEE